MSEHTITIIHYRLAKAKRTLFAAKTMAAQGLWEDCANRLYYACFHAVTALLLTSNYTAKTHTGIRNLFYQHFLSQGDIPKEFGETFSHLSNLRQESDYVNLTEFTDETGSADD